MVDLPTVLIVEDDDDLREAISDLAVKAGLVPVTAANGLEALCHLERCDRLPALVVLDLVMPVMDGWSLLRRRSDRWRDVPVVVLTGAGRQVPGDVTVLHKPITSELLLHALVTRGR